MTCCHARAPRLLSAALLRQPAHRCCRLRWPAPPQVRSFAKEGARLGAYEQAQRTTLRWGLRSAALDGCFFPLSNMLASGGWEAGGPL